MRQTAALSRRLGTAMQWPPLATMGPSDRLAFLDSVAGARSFTDLPSDARKAVEQAEATASESAPTPGR